jgi:hypothetical protein
MADGFLRCVQKMVPRPCGSRVISALEKYPVFGIGVSRDGAFWRFDDTKIQRFDENLYHNDQTTRRFFARPISLFSLTDVLGQTCSERCSFAAVSGV